MLNRRGFLLLEFIIGLSLLSLTMPFLLQPTQKLQRTIQQMSASMIRNHEWNYILKRMQLDLKLATVIESTGTKLQFKQTDGKTIVYMIERKQFKRRQFRPGLRTHTIILDKTIDVTDFSSHLISPQLMELSFSKRTIRVFCPNV